MGASADFYGFETDTTGISCRWECLRIYVCAWRYNNNAKSVCVGVGVCADGWVGGWVGVSEASSYPFSVLFAGCDAKSVVIFSDAWKFLTVGNAWAPLTIQSISVDGTVPTGRYGHAWGTSDSLAVFHLHTFFSQVFL
jgi:hypothetical protein